VTKAGHFIIAAEQGGDECEGLLADLGQGLCGELRGEIAGQLSLVRQDHQQGIELFCDQCQ